VRLPLRATDVLRWNRAYAALHPALVSAPPGRRNTLWHLFAEPEGRHHIDNRDERAPEAVAGFRKRYDVAGIGEVGLRPTGMEPTDHPALRLVVQTPTDSRSRENIDRLLRRATHL
jgi:hypothetical protein